MKIIALENKHFKTVTTLSFKYTLLLVAAYHIECISNLFKKKEDQKIFDISDKCFLTNLALFYTIFCVIAGIFRNYHCFFKELHAFILPTALVLEVIVTGMFWSLFIIDKKLVMRFDKYKNSPLLSYLSECPRHLFPLLVLLLEHMTAVLRKSPFHKIFLFVFAIVYFTINELLIGYRDIFLYPFLERFTFIQRGLIFASLSGISLLLYEIWAKVIESSSWKLASSPVLR
ncbi:hypothetical protein GINT2_001644 [Glugoides intestinalis]